MEEEIIFVDAPEETIELTTEEIAELNGDLVKNMQEGEEE